VNSEPTEDQLDRIKSEIRADADAARRRAPLPERRSSGGDARGLPETAPSSSISELARHAGPAFVDNAYRAILGRPPDGEGFARQMAALGAGASKIEIIGDLRYSAEGKRNAAPIPGLLPRYLLAKLGRVPVLGAIVQWLTAAASLPHLLRHQRATEASLAVRFGEVTASLQAAEQRDGDLRGAIDATRADLASAVAELSERLTRSEVFAQDLGANLAELRQLALTMNHWTVQVRKSIDAIEAAEAERRARDDETAAAILLRARERDTQRQQRLRTWADALARRIPEGATVVDLEGGADWLTELASRGWRVGSIETNAALHREARARGFDVSLGDPATLFARVEDGSVDALTLASPDRNTELLLIQRLREAQRMLRRGGALLLGLAPAHAMPEPVTPDTLAAVGFGDAETLGGSGGEALLATRT
jgi:hypothetical protein